MTSSFCNISSAFSDKLMLLHIPFGCLADIRDLDASHIVTV
jgi:hypothetical protein